MPKGGHEIATMVCKLEKLAKKIFLLQIPTFIFKTFFNLK